MQITISIPWIGSNVCKEWSDDWPKFKIIEAEPITITVAITIDNANDWVRVKRIWDGIKGLVESESRP
jgi:hypothetical protein